MKCLICMYNEQCTIRCTYIGELRPIIGITDNILIKCLHFLQIYDFHRINFVSIFQRAVQQFTMLFSYSLLENVNEIIFKTTTLPNVV